MRTSIGILSLGVLAAVAAPACSVPAGRGVSGGHSSATPGTSSATPGASSAIGDRDMIVLLRDQMTSLVVSRGSARTRATKMAASHSAIVSKLQAARARTIRSFELVNGFSAPLSQAEIDELSARSEVLAVVPDRTLTLPRHARPGRDQAPRLGKHAPRVADLSGLCNTLEPEALQLTNAAFADATVPQAQTVLDGSGKPVIGSGVTVGILADGIDTTVPGFVRPDGSKVFVDYQDFSGDSATTPTGGAEMFGDASSIAAQDMPNGSLLTYDIRKFGNPNLPSPCNIHIRGVSPGASLVGLKVFSHLGYTTTSSFVQAIGYAVLHDHVDILNESFGQNVVPDYSTDPVSLANAAAISAGVFVSVATGDAGPTGTLASPGTDPSVLASGASTQFRLYAQVGLGVLPIASGFVSDNISAGSSGGFAQRQPRTVDVVAPGDLGWALCTPNSALYKECAGPEPIEIFGGTSEAAPISAGVAALVIQAYRSTHGGASPTPALVKRVIQSTATDLGAPSYEQGAGIVNALAAVDAALSVHDEHGSPSPRGTGLLAVPSHVALTANPGDTIQRTFELANTGTTTLHLQPTLQELGSSTAGQTVTVQVDPTAHHLVEQTFTVPEGADHLDASIAFVPVVGGQPRLVKLALLDPQGRQQAYSIPQGLGSGYGHVDAVRPAAGQWTAVVFTVGPSRPYAYTGPVQLTWATENYTPLGTVTPASLDLAPGAVTSISATFQAPAQPGDLAASLRLFGTSPQESIPVTLRTLVPLGQQGGSFTGTLTGGNGRPHASPTQTYAFDVPHGVHDLAVSLSVPTGGYGLSGLLIDPTGVVLDSASNVDASGAPQDAFQLFRSRPIAGRWRLVVMEAHASGAQTSIEFSANIQFDSAQVSAAGLPARGASVSANQGLSVPVTVTNTGAVAKGYFADARLRDVASVTLPQAPCAPNGPTTLPGFCSLAVVPTRTIGVRMTAQSTVPLSMDVASFTGSPEVWAQQTAPNEVTAWYTHREVPFGTWTITPALVGPFGSAGAPTENVTTTATAWLHAFDGAVTASTGDYWADQVLGTSTYHPLVLAPGASGTITLTIKPDLKKIGQTLRGSIYVDTANPNDGSATGDEVVALRYSYTVRP